MTTLDPAAAYRPSRLSGAGFATALFAATSFVSALLLFAVQPMFTRMLLPRLGGAPAVWSVAMVVFQAALLAGYAYAHLLTRILRPRPAALLHLVVLGGASAALPIGIAQGFESPPDNGLVLWLVWLIVASIGAPFAILSASAPLLQSWFAASRHGGARNPYVLYAASNVGSFAALIAYPFAIEPLLTLHDQARLWSLVYATFALMIGAVAVIAGNGVTIGRDTLEDCGPAPTRAQRLTWIALAAIPSGLVVAVTAHITIDVAAAPFLWVVPLALYLLTFVALFRDRPWVKHASAARLAPFAVTALATGLVNDNWLAAIVLNLAAFVLLALVCHGELYRRRPAARWLTEFYLWTSLGGVLGGAFAALLAPNLFSGTYEYQMLVVAALLAMPGAFAGGWRPVVHIAVATAVGLATIALAPAAWTSTGSLHVLLPLGFIAVGGAMLLRRHRPAELAGLTAFAFAAVELWAPSFIRVADVRSFFGVHHIVETPDRQFRLLYHGTTIHGAERVRAADGRPIEGSPLPRTYYYFGGPLSEGIAVARAAQGGLTRVAAVGLGTGSLACHKQNGEAWTFYEIDPQVVRIARDPRLLHFLSACAPDAGIVLGDARLTLTASRETYDLIVLDAFSSDMIPVHLLTREAFAGYLSRLSPRGVIIVHISNRHMELSQVVASVGAAEHLVTFVKRDRSVADPLQELFANALVAVLARAPEHLSVLPAKPGWRRIEADSTPWIDDYSNVFGALVRKQLQRD